MVRVIITPSAEGDAKSIYRYYDSFSHRAAQKLKKEIVDAAKRLEQMPEMGPKEPLLKQYNKNYRYVLVLRTYKLIYLYENDVCSILMVWDCRQNPKLMIDSDRFES